MASRDVTQLQKGIKDKSRRCFKCGKEGHYKKDCPLIKDSKPIKDISPSHTPARPSHASCEGSDKSHDSQVTPTSNHTPHSKRYKDTIFYSQISSHPHYIDTHCHVDYLLERHRVPSYGALADKFQYPDNFDGCITSFCDPVAYSSFGTVDELLSEDKIWAGFGLHPHHARCLTPSLDDKITSQLSHPKCIALGEIGLDYSEHSLRLSDKGTQSKSLQQLLQYGLAFDKPIIIHCRDAEDDLLSILSSSLPPDWFIHLHCYTGSLRMAQTFLQAFPNLFLGLTGHVTNRKFVQSRLIAEQIPLDRLLLETDSPYMMPRDMRSHGLNWSHPPMAACVAQEIATLRDCPLDQVLIQTRDNARKIYRI